MRYKLRKENQMRQNIKYFFLVTMTAGFIFNEAALMAQGTGTVETRIEELENKLNATLEALAEMPVGEEGSDKLHFHGYGELHYNTTTQPGKDDKMDFHRAVLGLSYSFADWIILDTEVDFEHAATEMELEFAHVSFLLSDAFNVRVGSMLMPMGYLNEFHEPPRFYSVERPHVQKYVIPTTWNEGGAGIFGTPVPGLNYRLYLVGGLDAGKFTASSGIRSGRGKVAESIANDLAGVGRLEYSGIPGIGIGISGYVGNAGQNNDALGDASVSIIEADLRWRWRMLELTGLIASVDIDDTDKIEAFTADAVNGIAGQVVGSNILGWYVETAVHLGNLFLPEQQDLVVFVRHEQFNTQEDVAVGFSADPKNDREVTAFGLAYYPIRQVVIKVDIESWQNGAGDDWRQANVGIGYEY